MKQKIIAEVQKEIKEIMKYNVKSNFCLQIVCDGITEVYKTLRAKKEFLKSNRAIVKLLDKHTKDGSLKKHDKKMVEVRKELKILAKLDIYKFLIRGEYFCLKEE